MPTQNVSRSAAVFVAFATFAASPVLAAVGASPAAAQNPSAASSAPRANTSASDSAAEPPAMLNLGGYDVFSIHSSSGGLSPQQRVDQITSRLTPLLGVPSIPTSAVRIFYPTGGNPSIYVFGRRIVTVDQKTASSEGYKKPIDLATEWAQKLQKTLPLVNYRAPGQAEPTIPDNPKVTVTDKLEEVGGSTGEVKIDGKVVVRLRGVVQGQTAAERSDAIRSRLFRALRQTSPAAASQTSDTTGPPPAKTTAVAAEQAKADPGMAPAAPESSTQQKTTTSATTGGGASATHTAPSSSSSGPQTNPTASSGQSSASISTTAPTNSAPTTSTSTAAASASSSTTAASTPSPSTTQQPPTSGDSSTQTTAAPTPDQPQGPAISVQPLQPKGRKSPADSGATGGPVQLIVNGVSIVTVGAAEAKAAGQPSPEALAQAWAKNIQQAVAAKTTPPSAPAASPAAPAAQTTPAASPAAASLQPTAPQGNANTNSTSATPGAAPSAPTPPASDSPPPAAASGASSPSLGS